MVIALATLYNTCSEEDRINDINIICNKNQYGAN